MANTSTTMREHLRGMCSPKASPPSGQEEASHDEEEKQLALQVAGHGGIYYPPSKEGKGDTVLRKPTRLQEAIFYQHCESDPLLKKFLQPWIPAYLGMSRIPDSIENTNDGVDDDQKKENPTKSSENKEEISATTSGGEDVMCLLDLENLCAGMKRPCVMDIKIGAVRYTPQTKPEKIAKILKKEGPNSSPVRNFLRVSGSHQWRWRALVAEVEQDVSEKSEVEQRQNWELIKEDKDRGRQLSREDFIKTLVQFCVTSSSPLGRSGERATPTLVVAKALLSTIHQQVSEILSAVKESRLLDRYSITAASLLIVYDNDVVDTEQGHDNDHVRLPPPVIVKLIDFGRSGPRDAEGKLHFPDATIKFEAGLENLCAFLLEAKGLV